MVFGVFDRLHSGHRAFLRQAKKHGKKLMVVIAHDSSVLKLKKKRPWQSERQRMVAIRKIRGVSKAILGDQKQSSYSVIKKYKPDIIYLGYDQTWLAKDLRAHMRRGKILHIRLVKAKAYKPKKYHTSLLQ